jgi:site-specific DNA-cytosine methylase
VVAYCERDAFCAAVLLARMQDAALDPAPVWCGDLERLPVDELAGRVDLVTAGFPCPPYSVAGKRAGADDERDLWPAVWSVVRGVGARFLLVENVSGFASHAGGLTRVVGDLASAGWAAEWTSIRASDAGAPHRRERIFLLAWRVPDAERDALRQLAERGAGAARQADARHTEPGDVGTHDPRPEADVSLWATPTSRDWKDTPGMGTTREDRPGEGRLDQLPRQAHQWPTPTARDPNGQRGEHTRSGRDLSQDPGRWPTPRAQDSYERRNQATRDRILADGGDVTLPTLVSRWPTPTAGDGRAAGSRNAPGSGAHAGVSLSDAVTTGSSTGRQGAHTGRLSPAFVESLMGFPVGWTDPCGPISPWPGWPPGPGDSEGWALYLERGGPAPVCGPVPDRAARLAALGNSCCPQQVALALAELLW